jgi:hypothetical protein
MIYRTEILAIIFQSFLLDDMKSTVFTADHSLAASLSRWGLSTVSQQVVDNDIQQQPDSQ